MPANCSLFEPSHASVTDCDGDVTVVDDSVVEPDASVLVNAIGVV